jgi:hypothetical protein
VLGGEEIKGLFNFICMPVSLQVEALVGGKLTTVLVAERVYWTSSWPRRDVFQ